MKAITVMRPLIALLLCVLLPLQAGATLVRATTMARHGGAHTLSAPGLSESRAQTAPAHDAHHAGNHAAMHVQPSAHAGHEGHEGHDRPLLPADGNAVADKAAAHKANSHQDRHAKAGCSDCAKCCLQAASAPPPMLSAIFSPAVARASFSPQDAPAPAFLTDGPERPPRALNA